MVGIGGIGMSALAQILIARGVSVSGSDAQASEMIARLVGLGGEVTVGHRGDLVRGASRVVISDAIQSGNPELEQAERLGIPVQRRSQLMAELMAGSRGIAVAGTHGKTTVTAMIGVILVEGGLDPTVVVGGEHPALGGNARAGRGEWFVVEACEAYESFLDLRPEIALVSNMEPDHLDHHRTEAHLRGSFARFLNQVGPEGCAVLCADRPELSQLASELNREVLWYGTSETAGVRGTDIELSGLEARCQLSVAGKPAGELHISVPGVHNLINALGAVAVAWRAGVPLSTCNQVLSNFTGVARRFEVVGEGSGVTVVDDYAHHPTELAATIAAARAGFPGRRVVAVFQPHLYSRTRDFAGDFAEALSGADLAVLTDIYPAREAPIFGVSSGLVASHLRRLGEEGAVLEMPKEDVATKLPARLDVGDVVLVMGAGDIGEVAGELVRHLGGKPVGRQEVVAKE
jgi:UDP-N-acetylmuramate--alanine ligase